MNTNCNTVVDIVYRCESIYKCLFSSDTQNINNYKRLSNPFDAFEFHITSATSVGDELQFLGHV